MAGEQASIRSWGGRSTRGSHTHRGTGTRLARGRRTGGAETRRVREWSRTAAGTKVTEALIASAAGTAFSALPSRTRGPRLPPAPVSRGESSRGWVLCGERVCVMWGTGVIQLGLLVGMGRSINPFHSQSIHGIGSVLGQNPQEEPRSTVG